MFQNARRALALPMILALTACFGDEPGAQLEERGAADTVGATTEPDIELPSVSTGPAAAAILSSTEGHETDGLVWFTRADEDGGGVHIEADIDNIPPGPHGFHIHENGDCSAPDASSAGDHFAPDGSPHGAPTDPPGQRHAGDLGNLDTDMEGNGSYDRIDPVIQLEGPNSIIGRAVVLHEMPDDLESQPSGAAGDPIACGVIEAGSSEDM